MSLFYFSGKETFLKHKEIRKISETIEFPEMNIQYFSEYSDEILQYLEVRPLLGEKKICILYFFPDSEQFLSYLSTEGIPDYADVYIVVSAMPDMRKKTVKAVLKHATERTFDKVSEKQLYASIEARLSGKYHFPVEEIRKYQQLLMAAFHAYFMHADMDLEQVIKYVDQIGFSGSLSPETIQAYSPDSSDLRAFRLATLLLSGDSSCVEFGKKLLEDGEQPIYIISLVLYQLRICYKAKLFSDENYKTLIGIQGFQLFKDFDRYSAATYKDLMNLFVGGINRIKKGEAGYAVFTDCLTASSMILKEE